MDETRMDARNHGIAACLPREAKAVWRRWCALACVLLFALAGVVQGQDVTPDSIAIYADLEIDNLGIKATIEDNLLSYGIELVWADDRESVIIALYYREFSDRELVYVGHRVAPHITLPATLLEFSPGVSGVYNAASPDDLRALTDFVTGLALFSFGRYQTAMPYFEHLLEFSTLSFDSPGDFANFYLGMCLLLDSQDYKRAAYYLEKAFQGFHDQGGNAVFYGAAANLAWIYLQLGHERTATRWIDQYVEMRSHMSSEAIPQPHNTVTARIKRAEFYALIERYADAITDLTAAIELEPEDPKLYTMRGQMYLALYEWDAALADYNAALELAPDYTDTYFYRGVLYASILQTGLDTRDDALADFRRYLDLAPDGDRAADAAQHIADLEAAQDALGTP
ncbi:MAG: tetratricopeptide repeat protein [Chloroflexi bacterium]|nr:tetratricopeptide repeat protein [Chloroflexota bacterium]